MPKGGAGRLSSMETRSPASPKNRPAAPLTGAKTVGQPWAASALILINSSWRMPLELCYLPVLILVAIFDNSASDILGPSFEAIMPVYLS